jgi:hypothetical protein
MKLVIKFSPLLRYLVSLRPNMESIFRSAAECEELQFCMRHRGGCLGVIHLRSDSYNLGQITSLSIIKFIPSPQQTRCSVKMQRADSFETLVHVKHI